MILTVLIAIHIVLLLNLQFTAWPEIFSFPYLFNNGFDLYKDMIHPYTPLLTTFLSYLYLLFGYNVWVVKILTYLLVIGNDILIFKITKKLTSNAFFAILAVIFYVLTQPFLEGNQLWFDFAISTPILLGTLFLINKKYFWSGVFYSVAFLIKQNSAIFVIFAFLYSLQNKNYQKLLLGSILPILPFALYLYQRDSILDFFNWVLIYPSKYWTNFPGYIQAIPSTNQIIILIILLLPSIYLLFKNKISNRFLLLGFLGLSIILIYPRFSFFHFQTGIAFLAIIFGVTLTQIKNKYYIYAYLLILLFITKKDWSHTIRFMNDTKLVKQQSEKIYLLGLHSLNYVISNTLPPKPWIDNYGWYFEMPNMQENMLNGWKLDPPQYIYWSTPNKGNWYDLGVYQPKEVVKYIKANYKKVDEQEDVEVWKIKNI